MPLGRHFQLVGLLICCLLQGNTALAQTPEPTAIKYPDATASPAVKAAFTQALEKCQTEVREDYARRIAKAVADGKSQFVAILERRREEALVSLCQLTADIATADQRIATADQRIAANRADIAAADQRIAAGRTEIAASEALGAAYGETKRVADKIASGKETPKDIADLQVAYQYLKTVNAEKPELGIKQVLDLIEPMLAKYKRLQSLK